MPEEKYQQLMATSTKLDTEILKQRKLKCWEYFRNLGVPIYNLEKNIQSDISIYFSDVQSIHGSRMCNIGYFNGKSEIFLDKDFCSNPNSHHIVDCQITHELLHSLNRLVTENNEHYIMGHYPSQEYSGVEEALTQMFAEKIEGIELSTEEDYLNFTKNIMRIVTVIVGEKKVASQFLNNDRSMEEEITRLTNNPGWFEAFSHEIKKSYSISKANAYNNTSEIEKLNEANNKIINGIQVLISAKLKENSNILQEISNEFGETPPEFLGTLGIELKTNKL